MIKLPLILRLLKPKILSQIMDYVFKKNDLDYKVDGIIKRMKALEKDTHPPKNWDAKIKTISEALQLLKEKKC